MRQDVNDTTIIIPVKDEEVGLLFLLQDYKESNISAIMDINFIFVIDCRTSDNSKNVASKFSEIIINQDKTHGKGAAIRQALETWKKNKTEYVVFMDADGSYCFKDVMTIINALENDHDVVSGSRFLLKNKDLRNMSLLHNFGNRALSLISSIRNRRKISDLCTGLWGFNSKSIEILNLKSKGFDLEAEIAGKAKKNNLNHKEVPVTWNQRRGGFSKLKSFRDGFVILIRVIFR